MVYRSRTAPHNGRLGSRRSAADRDLSDLSDLSIRPVEPSHALGMYIKNTMVDIGYSSINSSYILWLGRLPPKAAIQRLPEKVLPGIYTVPSNCRTGQSPWGSATYSRITRTRKVLHIFFRINRTQSIKLTTVTDTP